jgi:hypothetical protein
MFITPVTLAFRDGGERPLMLANHTNIRCRPTTLTVHLQGVGRQFPADFLKTDNVTSYV